MIQSAAANIMIVNSPFDQEDADPRDGVCDTHPPLELCTLRAALQEHRNRGGLNEIHFDLGVGPKTIFRESPLPFVFGGLTLDGMTQRRAEDDRSDRPLIVLDGSLVQAGGNGLELRASGP